jgi:hypothetical protein
MVATHVPFVVALTFSFGTMATTQPPSSSKGTK